MTDIKAVLLRWFTNFSDKELLATPTNKFAGSGVKN